MNEQMIISLLMDIQKELHTIATSMQENKRVETFDEFEEIFLDSLSPGALNKITNPRLVEKINIRAHR
ncbi:hypothetical protein GHI93_11370 [Lactococcus hircilactis]|uniref:Uncharacterized protein n=1 Tax=Lactococcus hircilactis TaxID=1494462 RepID=A0A7X1ZAW8_9LACT|nr:hypothetical protein [Lactococcus hircilactis]MQW40519.1 hypothetical protein [Lactococcus hircilactis]